MAKKYVSFLVSSALTLAVATHAWGGYFTIYLHNGNSIKTEKYVKKNSDLLFYTEAGSAIIPGKLIKQIGSNDGILTSSVYYQPQSPDEASGLAKLDVQNKKTEEIIADINDRISVTETNIVNLLKNKETYAKRKQRYGSDKERAQKRIDTLQQDSYISSKDLNERRDLEQRKISDADTKINETNQEIQNTEKMLESQKRMKQRLENELQRMKRS